MINGLPTDNLYKFLTVAGLLTMAYCISLSIIVLEKDLHHWERLQVEMAEISIGIEFLREDAAIDSAQGLESVDRSIEHLRESRPVRKANAIFGAKLEAAKRLNRRSRWIPALAAIGSVLGLVLSVSGFILWYIRLQRPLDLSMALRDMGPESTERRQEEQS